MIERKITTCLTCGDEPPLLHTHDLTESGERRAVGQVDYKAQQGSAYTLMPIALCMSEPMSGTPMNIWVAVRLPGSIQTPVRLEVS